MRDPLDPPWRSIRVDHPTWQRTPGDTDPLGNYIKARPDNRVHLWRPVTHADSKVHGDMASVAFRYVTACGAFFVRNAPLLQRSQLPLRARCVQCESAGTRVWLQT